LLEHVYEAVQFQAAVFGNYQDKEKDRNIGNYAIFVFYLNIFKDGFRN
jgi:hypothetical protein